MFLVFLQITQDPVLVGSVQHVLPILIGFVIAMGLIRYANKFLRISEKQRVIHAFAWLVSITVVSYHVYRVFFENYNFKTDLPLYLCSLMAIIIPIFTHYRKYWMFEVLVFWIIGGTIQGVITPDIPAGCPSFDYYRYWVVHLGLLTIIFYFIFVFKYKPKLESVFISFLLLQVYVLFMMILNYFLEANYFYLKEKPKSASLLDYFGEWPNYIWIAQLVVIPLFLIIYLPFYLSDRKQRSLGK
jgi:hypothetical integral membrane protein (TIGR02206 family)